MHTPLSDVARRRPLALDFFADAVEEDDPEALPEGLRRRVLVVDDSPQIREIIGRALTRSGYEVILAEDGRRALELLESVQVDLVVLDLMMPNIGGVRVAKLLRHSELNRNAAVIVVSALDDDETVDAVFESGAAAYIAKPFKITQILSCASDLMRQ